MITRRARLRWPLALLALVAACTSGGPLTTDGSGVVVPGGCEEVPIATSPEKFTLFTSLAETFNATETEFEGECAVITVYRASSGAAARMLAEGWPEDGSAGPLPVIWSPAASTWGAIVRWYHHAEWHQHGLPARSRGGGAGLGVAPLFEQ